MDRTTEAGLLDAMAKATSQAEQEKYAAELEALRSDRRATARAQTEGMWAEAAVPPAPHRAPFSRTTQDSDWLGTVATVSVPAKEAETAMRAEASAWYSGLHPEVKAEGEEVLVQAIGLSDRLASQYGNSARVAQVAFLEQVRHHAEVESLPIPDPASIRPDIYEHGTGPDDTQTSASDTPSLAEGDEPEGDTAPGAPVAGTENLDAATWPTEAWPNGDTPPGGTAADLARKSSSRRTASISLKNVGIDGPGVGIGTDPSGNRVKFRLSEKDEADLKAVLYSDMAINFSGVEIEQSDVIEGTTASRRRTASQTCSVCGDPIEHDPASEDPSTYHHTNGEKHDHEAKPASGGGETKESSFRRVTAAADGEHSYCRICGVEMQSMEYNWYALSASTPQRDVGQHYHLPARNADWPGEFNAQGELVPGTPGGGGGQYDAPAGTIYDAGGKPIRIVARRRTAARIDTLREIVERHQHQEIDGMIVDTTTANLLLQVYDALSEGNKARFDDMPLERLVDLGWKHVSRRTTASGKIKCSRCDKDATWRVDQAYTTDADPAPKRESAPTIFFCDEHHPENLGGVRSGSEGFEKNEHQGSLAAFAPRIAVGEQDRPAVQVLARLKGVDDTFQGISGRQVVSHLLTVGRMDPATRAALKATLKTASGTCVYASEGNCSDDVTEVYHGEATPLYLCGFHEQKHGVNDAAKKKRETAASRRTAAVGDPCWSCGGKGWYSTPMGDDFDDPYGEQRMEVTCSTCGGSGVVNEPTDYPLADDPIFTDRYSDYFASRRTATWEADDPNGYTREIGEKISASRRTASLSVGDYVNVDGKSVRVREVLSGDLVSVEDEYGSFWTVKRDQVSTPKSPAIDERTQPGHQASRRTAAGARPLYEIAAQIEADWGPKVYFGARPYLDAMHCLTTVNDAYGMDDAKSIVLYFLSNATTWRGEVAREVKKELKALVDGRTASRNRR